MWIIAILAELVVFLCFAICVPLDIALQADVGGKLKLRFRFFWIFGLVSREMTRKTEKSDIIESEVKSTGKHRRVYIRILVNILRTQGILQHLKRLKKDVLDCFSFRKLAANFKIGLGDPADTGFLFTFIGPTAAVINSSDRYRIRLEPSFNDGAVFQGYSCVNVRVHPILLVPTFIKIIFSFTAIRVAWIFISSKWKRRK